MLRAVQKKVLLFVFLLYHYSFIYCCLLLFVSFGYVANKT